MNGHHHPTSSHTKKHRGGRLQTHTVRTDDKKHSPSALLVCDTRADNAESVCSGSGGRYLLFHSLLRKALLWTLAPLPASFCPPLCLSSVFNWTFLLFSRMSRAIGSHLLLMRLWVVGQIEITNWTVKLFNNYTNPLHKTWFEEVKGNIDDKTRGIRDKTVSTSYINSLSYLQHNVTILLFLGPFPFVAFEHDKNKLSTPL